MEDFIKNGLIADAVTRSRLAASILHALQEGLPESVSAEKGTEHVIPAIHFLLEHPEVQAEVDKGEALPHLAAGLMLKFIRDSQKKLNDLGHPDLAEQRLCEDLSGKSDGLFQGEDWPDIRSLLERCYRKEEIDPHFFEAMSAQLFAREGVEDKMSAQRDMFLRDWGGLIDQKRIAYQRDKVDSWRDAFLQMLLQYLRYCKRPKRGNHRQQGERRPVQPVPIRAGLVQPSGHGVHFPQKNGRAAAADPRVPKHPDGRG